MLNSWSGFNSLHLFRPMKIVLVVKCITFFNSKLSAKFYPLNATLITFGLQKK